MIHLNGDSGGMRLKTEARCTAV